MRFTRPDRSDRFLAGLERGSHVDAPSFPADASLAAPFPAGEKWAFCRAIFAALCTVQCLGCAGASRTLELDELAVWSGDPAFTVAGGGVSADGYTTLWSSDGTVMLLDPSLESVRSMRIAGENSIVAAQLEPDGVAHVVTSLPARALRVSQVGGTTLVHTYASTDRLIDASRTTNGWLLVVQSRAPSDLAGSTDPEGWGATRVDHLTDDGSLETLTSDHMKPGSVFGSPGQVFYAELHFPGRLFRLGRTQLDDDMGEPVMRASPMLEAFTDGLDSVPGALVGLRPVLLDAGSLQVVADPASLTRFWVLRDERWNIERVTELSVPMGIIGVVQGPRHLVAYRHLDRPEVVLYRWRWAA